MNRILTVEEYLNTPRPNLNWIIYNQLPKPGTLLLQGPPKEGKSFLALQLGLAIAQGQPFLNWPVTQARVLYLQFDVSELVWRNNLERIGEQKLRGPLHMVHPEDFRLPISITNPEHQKWLRDIVNTSYCDVFIVDVFREIHTSDENDSTAMKFVCDRLMDIFNGRTLILVHHTRKIPVETIEPDVATLARGSSYLTGKVDAIWLLWKNQLYIQGRMTEPQQVKLKRLSSGLWTLR